MALPPHTIRIKRPLDDAPVQYLHIDRTDTKRQKTASNFVFKLAHTVSSPTSPAPPPFKPYPLPSKRHGTSEGRSASYEESNSDPASPNPAIPMTPLTPRHPSGIRPDEKQERTRGKLHLTTVSAARSLGKNIPLSAIDPDSPPSLKRSSSEITSPCPETPISPILIVGKANEKVPARQGTFGDLRQFSGALSPTGQIAQTRGDSGVETPMWSPAVVQDSAGGEPTVGEKRKTTGIVRKYHLAKRLRLKGVHPYAPPGSRRSAIFIRTEEGKLITPVNEMEVVPTEEQIVEEVKERKRPRTHAKEKAQIEERMKSLTKPDKGKEKEVEKKKGVKFEDTTEDQLEDDLLTRQLNSMVLDYLNSEQNDGIKNLPPTSPVAKKPDLIGGGLGGGSWKDVERRAGAIGEEMDTDEDEEGYVYDVYFREEAPAGGSDKKEEGDYGVLVIEGSDDEQWWYEGDEDVDSEGDIWCSDDEDSNAEDYHTNDYPEEPEIEGDYDDDSDADPISRLQTEFDDADSEYEDSDDEGIERRHKRPPWKSRDVKGYDEEEFDLENDEAEEEGKLKGLVKGIWEYRDAEMKY